MKNVCQFLKEGRSFFISQFFYFFFGLMSPNTVVNVKEDDAPIYFYPIWYFEFLFIVVFSDSRILCRRKITNGI